MKGLKQSLRKKWRLHASSCCLACPEAPPTLKTQTTYYAPNLRWAGSISTRPSIGSHGLKRASEQSQRVANDELYQRWPCLHRSTQTPKHIQKVDPPWGFCNLHHRDTRFQNWGFYVLDPPRGLGMHTAFGQSVPMSTSNSAERSVQSFTLVRPIGLNP